VDSFKLFQLIQILLGFYTWTLIGQGVLFLFTGANSPNAVARMFRQINFPATWLTRRLAPRIIADRHIPMLTFMLVIVLRLLTYVVFFRAGAIPVITPVQG